MPHLFPLHVRFGFWGGKIRSLRLQSPPDRLQDSFGVARGPRTPQFDDEAMDRYKVAPLSHLPLRFLKPLISAFSVLRNTNKTTQRAPITGLEQGAGAMASLGWCSLSHRPVSVQ